MATLPTHDDANLILRLFELRREATMREARAWFVSHYYSASPEEHARLCPPGSREDAFYRMVVSYWDMAASFVVSGVLNQDLFLASANELLLTWDRVRDMIEAARQTMSPLYLANLEKVAQAAIERMEQARPGTFAGFSKRTRGLIGRAAAAG